MSDLTTFESVLERRIRAHASTMRPSTDAPAIVRQAVLANGRANSSSRPIDRRWVLLAAALLVAAALAVAVAGALRTVPPLSHGSIVFTTVDGVWSADAAGSNRRLLLPGDRLVDPRVSPDGRYILLHHYVPAAEPDVSEILVVDLTGRTIGRWDGGLGEDYEWVSAQGGPLILYENLGSWNVVTPSGDAVFRLVSKEDGAIWSPEGSLPAGVSSLFFQGSPSRLHQYVAGQAQASVVVERPFAMGMGRHRPSPDGSSIAYVLSDCSARPCVGELWIKTNDGKPSRQLLQRVATYSDVVWDLDGRSIVVTGMDELGHPQAARVHLDGRVDAIPLRDEARADSLRFALAPDPDHLTVIGEADLVRPVFTVWSLDVVTGERSLVVTDAFGVDRREQAPPGP